MKLSKIIQHIIDNPIKFANKLSIPDLVKLLQLFSDHYYNTGQELISDDLFDLLVDNLSSRDPTNPFLKKTGSVIVSKNKVKLPYPMPSLDKIKPNTDSLLKFTKKFKGPYVLSDKLDGVSAMYVHHSDSRKQKLYTRGDGSEGQDISYLIKYVIDSRSFKNAPNFMTFRGELIMTKKSFLTIRNKFKNARNVVAGLVNSKHFSVKIASLVDFIAYSILNPLYPAIEQINIFNKLNIPHVHNIIKDSLSNDFLSNYLVDRRSSSPFDIDGIVVFDSSIAHPLSSSNPSYAFAFKKILTDQTAEAFVLDVEWNISKDGYLKPRLRIETITLAGVDISFVTAFNAKYVVDNVLGPGAKILLIRSGDVIPHILKTLSPASNNSPKLPSVPYYWSKSGIDLIVQNTSDSDDIKIKQLANFFKTLNVKFISDGILHKLVSHGYDSIFKILAANPSHLANIDGLGSTLVNKILTNISNAFKNTSLVQLMAASNIFGRGFGTRRIKLILDAYPNILHSQWNKNTLFEKIKLLDGFDDITASQFASNFLSFLKFFRKLNKFYDFSSLSHSVTNSSSSRFLNKKFVFTGFRDSDLVKFIESHSGSVTNSVSKNTSFVIFDNASSSNAKLLKAQKLDIPIISKSDFIKKYFN